MFIAFGELTPLFWWLLGGVLFFALQLPLCFWGKKTSIKCIPLYLVALGFLFSLATYCGVFGTYSAGVISGNALVAVLLAFGSALAALGVFLAWLVYWIVRFIKGNRRRLP